MTQRETPVKDIKDWELCHHCQGSVQGGSVEIQGPYAYQDVHCIGVCGATWTEEYTAVRRLEDEPAPTIDRTSSYYLGKKVAEVDAEAISVCLCTLDEVFDGHRHHCCEHKICGDCVEDWSDDD